MNLRAPLSAASSSSGGESPPFTLPGTAAAWHAAIVDSADDAIIGMDRTGAIVSWNRGAERLFGYTPPEILGQSVTCLLPADRADEEPAILDRIAAGERVEHYETVRRRKDGSRVEVSLTVSPVRTADGAVVGASKVARDISDKRRAEELSRRLAAIIDSSDDAILSKDLNGTILTWNAGAERLFGYTAAETVGRSVTMLIPLGRKNEEPQILERIRRGDRIDHYETVRRRKDGSLVDVSLTVSPIRNALGQVVGASKIARDVSDRRRGDEVARRLAAIVESSDDAIISKNLDGVILSWNRGAERIFGYAAEEAVGQPVLMLIPEGRHDEEPSILNRLRKGERIDHYETVRRRKDGTLIDVSLTVSPIIDVRGQVIGASKIARDVTAQKHVQRELQRAHEKALAANRAKDDFLAALSHELRTPLNPVLLVASESALDHTLPAHARESFELIRKNVELEARLIDDLLDLARITRGKLPLHLATHDLHAILRDAISTVAADIEAKKQTLTCELAPVPLTITGDGVRLQQVIWNVLKNAVKFTPDAGRITIATRLNPLRHCAVVEVTDTGIGLEESSLERIFDAFTQAGRPPAGSHLFGGLGLGLTISRLITELHRGSIRAASQGPGRGATFVIELPLAEAPGTGAPTAVEPVASVTQPEPAKRKRRILLVEDHEASRVALARLLGRRQFDVSTASSGADARVLAQAGTFDLLICDIGLPDIDGAELIREFARNYGMRAVALTGFGMEDDLKRSREAGASAHLTKPVSIQALDHTLSSTIDLSGLRG